MTSLTPEQSRAARGLLDWSQSKLAQKSNLSESTVRDFEKDRRVPGPNNVAAIRTALESAGVIFIDDEAESGGPGVRLKPGFKPRVKLAHEGSHRGAYQRFLGGAPLVDPDEKK